jgi:hypothetical protein
MRLVTVLETLGLAAALAGGLSVVRGDWGEAAGCLVVLVVASFLAGLWETE